MKEIVNNYKEIFISFIKNKKYIVSIIFVAILSYGFTITNYSIGVDDLCFDRYVEGTYILSAKRWGTWLLYNVLNITTFSPFWLDFIVATLMCITAIVVCTIIKKIVKDKINIWGYIIFSAIFISNPLISQFFMYQSTNLTVVISNLIAICAATILFENAINIKMNTIKEFEEDGVLSNLNELSYNSLCSFIRNLGESLDTEKKDALFLERIPI